MRSFLIGHMEVRYSLLCTLDSTECHTIRQKNI